MGKKIKSTEKVKRNRKKKSKQKSEKKSKQKIEKKDKVELGRQLSQNRYIGILLL